MPYITVAQEKNSPVDLYYERYGEGQPIVLTHGWPLSGKMWEKQVSALVAGGFEVIAYDRRGFGQSSRPWSGYDYDTFAADLKALIDGLDLMDAVLVGFSMGGGEVVRYLSLFGSERVAKLVLAASVTPFLYQSANNPEGGVTDEMIAQFEGGVVHDRPGFLDVFVGQFFTAGDAADLVSPATHRYFEGIAALASPQASLESLRAFCTTDFRDEIASLTLPVLVLHGDADVVNPVQVSGERVKKALPHSELVIIAGGPHGLNFTHAEQFNQALLSFIKA